MKYNRHVAYITIIGLAVSFIPFANVQAIQLSSIPCAGSDSGQQCGGTYDFFPVNYSGAPYAGCGITGNQNETQPSNGTPVTILGGQDCVIGGGNGAVNQPGDYTYVAGNNVSPSTQYYNITGMPGYNGDGMPPGYTYTVWPLQYNSVPSGEFPDPSQPAFYNDAFFPGTQAQVEVGHAGDHFIVTIGSNVYSERTNTCRVTDVSANHSPTFTGTPNFTVNPGDPITVESIHDCRANNGKDAMWSFSQVGFNFAPVTKCYTAALLKFTGGFDNVTDYHPTANGVCTPSQPALDAEWQATGNAAQTVTLTPGQDTVTLPFNYSDVGDPTSIDQNVTCTASPISGSLPSGATAPSTNCNPPNLQNN